MKKYYTNKSDVTSTNKILNFIKKKNSDFWNLESKKRSLVLFKKAAVFVPAYKDFLRKNKVQPDKIKTFKDFQQIPPISKKNYLKQYPFEDLCWDGTLKSPMVLTSTSGSTGEPFYFPRWKHLDWEYSVLVEDFLRNSSYKSGGPVLVIIGFGMGVWIGGLITYKAFEIASQRLNLPVSIITPGINNPEIFKTLKNIAPLYKETILVGYPPFLKDVIDGARNEEINLRKLNIRLFSAAEAYTEKFREYIAKNAHVKNLHNDITNVYGTADIGAMAWETPTSILIRRLTSKNSKVFKEIFSQTSKTPTLAQYNPLFISFESVKGEIILTGNNVIPLIRYEVGDQGGVTTFDEIESKLKRENLDIKKESGKVGIKNLCKLPFVYIYERVDFSTKLYGATIYPENIKSGLERRFLQKYITGKFTMITKCDKEQNQYLEINLELKPNTHKSSDLKNKLSQSIVNSLLKKNAEYENNFKLMPKKVVPHIVFWPFGSSKYFKPGIKQRWVIK